jgi:hypothetical protein
MYNRYFLLRPLNMTLFAMACALTFCSCMKLTQVPPASTQLQTPTVFSGDAEAEASVAGLFSEMMTHPRWLFDGAITLYTGLGSDELFINNQPADPHEWSFAEDTLSAGNALCSGLYGAAFTYINTANAILQGLSASNAVSAPIKSRLQGEALFARALSYFYLVNLFGDVPYITGTNYMQNEAVARTPSSLIYMYIIADLKQAQTLLPQSYTGSLTNPNDRIYPNQGAATALLARVYLYMHDWADAETQAGAVIGADTLYALESDPDMVFLAASREAIWQLQPVSKYTYFNTGEASIFLPFSVFSTPLYNLDSGLLKAFEPNDLRRTHWVASRVLRGKTYTYPFKYKVSSGGPTYAEYNIVLRFAEQYLIRAEARAEQDEASGAAADLDLIRARAGLAPVADMDKDSLLADIYREKRIEFFAEWGHRWLDLKRSGQIDAVMSSIHPDWKSSDALYPVPSTELQLNPALTQNPGY